MVDLKPLTLFSDNNLYMKKRISFIICAKLSLFKSLAFLKLRKGMSEVGQGNHAHVTTFR